MPPVSRKSDAAGRTPAAPATETQRQAVAARRLAPISAPVFAALAEVLNEEATG
ncbi:MAG: hypothetical protein ACYDCQ_20010 [Dehalococcoidia bacterium]